MVQEWDEWLAEKFLEDLTVGLGTVVMATPTVPNLG